MLRALNRHGAARSVLEQASAFAMAAGDTGRRYWVLVFQGAVAAEAAEFEQAARFAREAAGLRADLAWPFGIEGWALENLGPDHIEDARSAYQKALRLDATNFLYRKGLANLQAASGATVADAYLPVIRWAEELAARGQMPTDPVSVATLGWCYCRMGAYDDALRCYSRALSADPSLIEVQLDLALAALCSGRPEDASREYRDALSRPDACDSVRWKGLVHVAVADLRGAIRSSPVLGEQEVAKQVLADLESRLRILESEVAASNGNGTTTSLAGTS